MGNYSLILVLGGTLLVSVAMFSTRASSDAGDRLLNDHTFREIAREAAISGLNLTVRKLVADTSSWITDPNRYEFTDEPYRRSTFSTKVLTPYGATYKNGNCWLDSVQVVSTGQTLEGTQYIVDSSYLRTCTDLGGVPPGFRYAIVTDEDLTASQKLTIMSPYDTSNANIHANGMFSADGHPYVEGYGTYTTEGGVCKDCDNFLPNDDFNGPDPNVHQADSVPLPRFNPPDFRDVATYIHEGDIAYNDKDVSIDFTNFNGITGYGTAENPYIWYIAGDVEIEANVRALGFGVIIIEGTLTVIGNTDIYSSVPPDQTPPASTTDDPNAEVVRPFLQEYMQQGSTLGLFVGGTRQVDGEDISVLIEGRSRIMGTMYLNGGLDVPGDMTLYGSLAGLHDFILDGKMMIWYEGANEAIVDVWNFGKAMPVGIEAFAWSEW
ncbi:MAG TPA: hypothetical protein VMO47_13305 [Rhodothermales bacterium]|nr:hypothetical protein [Rhodothermales bacterium]